MGVDKKRRAGVRAGVLLLAHLIFFAGSSITTKADGYGIESAVRNPDSGARFALVIGNQSYTRPLRTPHNDAVGMADALRDLGFQVQAEPDIPDKQKMEKVIRDFGEHLKGAHTALFYYAGHGVQVNGNNYLVPTQAKVHTLQDVTGECVNVEAIYKVMLASQNIIILHACRNNPFAADGWVPGLAIPNSNAPKETMIAYPTEPNKLASDEPVGGPYSRYTKGLIKFIRQPGLRIDDFFKLVRSYVSENTDGVENPWVASSFGIQNQESYFREPAFIVGQIDNADDEALVLVNGEPVLVWTVDGRKSKKIALKPGPNGLRIMVYNQKTFKEIFRFTPEGWKYAVRLSTGDTELARFEDGEDVPVNDGPHHGKTFTVATATIYVDETTGKVELKDVDMAVWRR